VRAFAVADPVDGDKPVALQAGQFAFNTPDDFRNVEAALWLAED
jgi:hypothetical protein